MAAVEIFVDSGAWLALALTGRTQIQREQHAGFVRAVEGLVRHGAGFVTTNLVIAETHQLMLIRDRRRTGLTFLRGFPAPGIAIVYSTPDLEARALREWLERFDDQDFSLTDAVSFTVMRDRGIRQALALDRHFAVAGFELLPPRGRR